jgi:hypothetical protein
MLAAAAAAGPWGARGADAPAVQLVDVTGESGVDFVHAQSPTTSKYLIETMGGGVGLLDYDGDGRLDVFLANGARLLDPMPPAGAPLKSEPRFADRLYRNLGQWRFLEAGEAAGVAGLGRPSYSTGVAVGDYDGDGRADLYVTGFPHNVLYRNEGGRFADVTERAGVAALGWSTSAGFFDYDRDGRLDLFVCRYVQWGFEPNPYCGERRPGYREYCHPRSFPPIASLLYRNRGDGRFEDVSDRAGIAAHAGKALGVAFADYDEDGWTDVYVANDAVPAFLFRNTGRGGFEEAALAAGVAVNAQGVPVAGMGADFGDYDADGRLDLLVTTLSGETYSLYRNEGAGTFLATSAASGLAQASLPFSGWGTRFLDYDNDGRLDLFVAQGHVLDTIELTSDHVRYAQPPLLLRNDGARLTSVGARAGPALVQPWAGRGAAFGDLDDDGDVDVVVSNCGQRPTLLRNDGGNGNHWLTVSLEGTRSNRAGLGARVTATQAGRVRAYEVSTAGSYQSASDARLSIGLGPAARLEGLLVRWPSGVEQRLAGIEADRVLKLREPEGP